MTKRKSNIFNPVCLQVTVHCLIWVSSYFYVFDRQNDYLYNNIQTPGILLMVPVVNRWTQFQPDTSRITFRKDTVNRKNSVQSTEDTSFHEKTGIPTLDSIVKILSQSERRLKKIDSINLRKEQVHVATPNKEKPVVKTNLPDTTQILARFRSFQGINEQELLCRIASYTPEIPEDSFMVYRPYEKKTASLQGTTTTYVSQQPVVIERKSAYLRENWFPGVLLLSFILIVWTKIRFGKLLNATLSGMWNYKKSFSLFRNRSSLYQQTSFLLFLNYLLSGGMFFYLSLKTFDILSFGQSVFPPHMYLIIILGLTSLYFYMYIVIRLTGFFSLAQEAMSEFSHFTNLFFHNTGLYLFPLNILIPYVNKEVVPWLIYAGLILIGGFYVLRIVKLLIIFIKKRFSLFFLFLYLCALEIIPFLIFIHLIFR